MVSADFPLVEYRVSEGGPSPVAEKRRVVLSVKMDRALNGYGSADFNLDVPKDMTGAALDTEMLRVVNHTLLQQTGRTFPAENVVNKTDGKGVKESSPAARTAPPPAHPAPPAARGVETVQQPHSPSMAKPPKEPEKKR